MPRRRLWTISAAVLLAIGAGVALLALTGGLALHPAASVLAAPLESDPFIIAIAPSSGPNDLNTDIVITGASFEAGASVHLGTVALPAVGSVSSTTLTATVGWGLGPGVYTATVTNPGGSSASLACAFTVTQAIGVWSTGGPYGGNGQVVAFRTDAPATVYAVAGDVGVFRSEDGANTWEPVLLAPLTWDPSFAVGADPDTLYVATDEVPVRSDDGGATWEPIPLPIAWHRPRLFAHPTDPDIVYATVECGADCGGVFRSEDRGQTWITLTTGLTDTMAIGLAFDPTDPLTMAVGTDNGHIFRSTDGGLTWKYTSTPLGNIWRLAPNPHSAHEIWATVDGRWGDPCATLKSANTELTAWTQVYDRCAWSIRFAPLGWGGAYSRTVFLAAWGEILMTDDGGDTWTVVTPANRADIALHPTDPAVMLLAGESGVERSLDGGATWDAANEGLAAVVPGDLATVPNQVESVYATGSEAGTILKSGNGGETWRALIFAESGRPETILVDPFLPSRLYVGGDPIYISNDGGQSWPVTATLPVPSLYTDCFQTGALIIADPCTPGVLLASSNYYCGDWGHTPGALYRSLDYGEHWSWLDVGQEISGVMDLTYNPVDPSMVYAGTQHMGVLRSTDGGLTWAPSNAGLEDDAMVSSIAVEPAPPYRMFADTEQGFYVSMDEGASWSPVQQPPNGISWRGLLFAPGDPPILYAATRDGLYRAVMYEGEEPSWVAAAGRLGHGVVQSLAIATDTTRVIVYAGVAGSSGAVESASYRPTTDGGRWTTSEGLCRSVVCRQSSASREGVGAPQAVAHAGADGGAGVYRITTPPMPRWVLANENGFGDADNFLIGALEAFNGRLYAGTWNEGGAQLWRSDSGSDWSPIAATWSVSTNMVFDAQAYGPYLYVGTGSDYGAAGELWRTDGLTWQSVTTDGFGDLNNTGVNALAIFSATLYVATTNGATGTEIWRSASGDPGTWSQVNADGFGGAGTGQDTTLDLFGGCLYTGLGRDGVAELWRTPDGLTWTPVFTDGLGSAHNTHVASLAEFGDHLYIGLRNVTTGGEVWRSADGLSWQPVVTAGLGNPDNTRPYGLIVAGEWLYLVIGNTASGAEVWRSRDGVVWLPANVSGWGDAANWHADFFDRGAAVFKVDLYVGTSNGDGGQVWRLMRARRAYLPVVVRGG